MIHGGIGGIIHIPEVGHIVGLLQLHGHVQNGKAALLGLTEADESGLDFGGGDARDGHDGDIAVLLEGLQAGALAGAVVLAQEGVGGDGEHRAVAAALEGEHQVGAVAAAQGEWHDGGLGGSGSGDLLAVLVLLLGGSGGGSLDLQHLHANQVGLGGLGHDVVQRLGLEGEILKDLHIVAQADGDGDLAGLDVLGGAHLGVGHIQGAGSVQGNHLVQHALDGGVGGGAAVKELHHVAGIEAVGVLQGQVGPADRQHLGLGLGGGREDHPHILRPGAGVGGGDLQHAAGKAGGLGVAWYRAHDVGPGAAVGEELLHRIGQEAVIAIGRLAEVAAVHPLVVGKAGNQLGLAHNGPPLRQTHKASGAGADALHGRGTGIILLYVNARG